MNEQILSWLRACGFGNLEPEYLGPREGDMGLFSRGVEVKEAWQDILGRHGCRLKAVFLLAKRTRDPGFLDQLPAMEPVLLQAAPIFGQDQRILLEKGRTAKDSGGIPVREFQLTVEFTVKEET